MILDSIVGQQLPDVDGGSLVDEPVLALLQQLFGGLTQLEAIPALLQYAHLEKSFLAVFGRLSTVYVRRAVVDLGYCDFDHPVTHIFVREEKLPILRIADVADSVFVLFGNCLPSGIDVRPVETPLVVCPGITALYQSDLFAQYDNLVCSQYCIGMSKHYP